MIIYQKELIELIRHAADLYFTGHDIRVHQKDHRSIRVFWEDGPNTQEVFDTLRSYGGSDFAYLFPDGSLSTGVSIVEGFRGCQEAYIKVGYVEFTRTISRAFMEQIREEFEQEYGVTIFFNETRYWDNGYRMNNPQKFVRGDGQVFERWSDTSKQYNHYQSLWTGLLKDKSEYDKEKAAINFITPLSVV